MGAIGVGAVGYRQREQSKPPGKPVAFPKQVVCGAALDCSLALPAARPCCSLQPGSGQSLPRNAARQPLCSS